MFWRDILGAVVALSLLPSLTSAAPVKAGQMAPAFAVKTLRGKSVSLAKFKGKIVLLDFGAVDCPPCRIEMPELEKFHKKYAGKGVVVLGLMEMNPKPGEVRKLFKKVGVTYPVAIDSGEKIGKRYGLEAHPTTVLIDRSGKVVKAESGFVRGDEKEMEKALLALLNTDTKHEAQP